MNQPETPPDRPEVRSLPPNITNTYRNEIRCVWLALLAVSNGHHEIHAPYAVICQLAGVDGLTTAHALHLMEKHLECVEAEIDGGSHWLNIYPEASGGLYKAV